MEIPVDLPITSQLLQTGVITVPKRIRKIFGIEIGDLITFQLIKVTKKREEEAE